jgi:uncharacterized protein YuzE
MKLEDKVSYDSEVDTLYIQVDKNPDTDKFDTMGDVITSTPVEHRVHLEINGRTGGLISIELQHVKEMMEGTENDPNLEYNSDEDLLVIPLTNESQNGGCDNVYNDGESIMIALNRNETGNLVGIEVVGLEKILASFLVRNN